MVETFLPWRGMNVATQRSPAVGPAGPDQMFPLRLTSPVPGYPIGRDITLSGIAEDGGFYYCKADNDGRPVRANEEVFTRLASHLGIPTAMFNVIRNYEDETFFGSLNDLSSAGLEAVTSYFRLPAVNELGGLDRSKSAFISRLFTLDMFIGNPDRAMRNLVAVRDGGFQRIVAIDFAECALLSSPAAAFPDVTTNTVKWRRALDMTHSFAHDAAEEMLNRIDAVPVGFFESIFERMQTGWLGATQQLKFMEFWGSDQRRKRVAALGAGLKDGTLR